MGYGITGTEMGPSDTHTPVMGQTTSTDSVQIKNLLLLVTWNCSYFAAYDTLRSAEPKNYNSKLDLNWTFSSQGKEGHHPRCASRLALL